MNIEYPSISSIAFFPNSDNVLLTISEPISKEKINKSPHLYIGKYDDLDNKISSVSPWLFSGFEDNSSCAHATINNKSNLVVFSKEGEKTQSSDLFLTEYRNNSWSIPTPINELNTPMTEIYPNFVGDTLLVFSSDGYPGYGGLDLFKTSSDFKSISHFKAPINSHKDDFNFYYINNKSFTFTSNRYTGMGDDDIYLAQFKQDETLKNEILEIDSVKLNFETSIKNWGIKKVYFDFDQDTFKKIDKSLDSLLLLYNDYKSFNIILEGHTDNRGSESYNNDLGYRRAFSVKEFLVRSGVNEELINVVSKGKSQPAIKCKGLCSDEIHSLNRFVIIRIAK
jgi:outer membrane protein OmpA-like peptidoglycan-associated protein